MAYQGYHLKFGNTIYPERLCCNYKCSPDRRTDKNSTVNSQGVLKRKILPHKRSGVTWNTGYITDSDITLLQTLFSNRDSIECTFWKPSTLSYATATCYIPDMEFEVLMTVNNVNYYRPVELELVEY